MDGGRERDGGMNELMDGWSWWGGRRERWLDGGRERDGGMNELMDGCWEGRVRKMDGWKEGERERERDG